MSKLLIVSLFLLKKSLDFSLCSILIAGFLTTIRAIVFTAFRVSEFKGYPLTCRVRLQLMLRLNLVALVHGFFVSEQCWKSFVLISSMKLLVYEEYVFGLCIRMSLFTKLYKIF